MDGAGTLERRQHQDAFCRSHAPPASRRCQSGVPANCRCSGGGEDGAAAEVAAAANDAGSDDDEDAAAAPAAVAALMEALRSPPAPVSEPVSLPPLTTERRS